MGREVTLRGTPQRIISLVPSQTELLFDLGLADKVVGVTKFCIHPTHARKEKKIIGGTKNFRFDVIDALQPDLIIGNKEENYLEGIEELTKKYPVWMSDIYTLEDSLKMITSVGEITGSSEKSDLLSKKIKKNFSDLPTFENKTVAYFIWKAPYMVVGGNTFINDMLSRIGLTNIFADKERYFTVDIQEIIILNIDYIFLSSEPFPFQEKNSTFMRNLFPESYVSIVDGESFSWYGSRILKSPSYFKSLYKKSTKSE